MYTDPTENERRAMAQEINERALDREALEKAHGQVWNTEELRRDFEVQGFLAPFCIVHRRSDGAVGTLSFQHDPRFYWGFEEDHG